MTAIMAASGGDIDLVNAIIWIGGMGLICWLLWWLVGYFGLPQPFDKVARALIALVAVVMLIRLIIRVTGTSF